jgi:hypothetical protein
MSIPRSVNSSERNSLKSRSQADRRGFTTKSNPTAFDGSIVRRISRTLLLIRFLSWALPNFRGVVRPNRLWFSPLGSANNTKDRDDFFAPFSYTDSNAAAFFNVTSTNSAWVIRASGLCPAWPSGPAGPRAFSCAAETRAFSRAGGCSVGMSSVASLALLPKF